MPPADARRSSSKMARGPSNVNPRSRPRAFAMDAQCLASNLQESRDIPAALKAYEAERLQPTANVVLENRRNPPDAILREIYERTGDRPFERIDAVISARELKAISDRYKGIAGYDKATLQA